jgi:SAM-dependent methyltransferase
VYETSEYYDLIYSFKDYQGEAERLRALLDQERPGCRTLLDVACGTGEHHRFLANRFAIDGVDLNPEFIEIARRKNPRCTYAVGDMTEFGLGKRFDALTCLFSAIGYVMDQDNLVRTLRCFREHLVDDGIILVEPWFTPETWKPPFLHTLTAEREGLKICRASSSQVDGRISRADMHFLIVTAEGVRYVFEEHALGLFTIDEMKQAFSAAGLAVRYDEEGLSGRGLYLARPAATTR